MFKLSVLLLLLASCYVLAADIKSSEITVVDDDSRWRVQHPEAEMVVFEKAHHVKGGYVFSSGKRISGDRLLLVFDDETQFTRSEDIEVFLRYPATGQSNNILTKAEIYVTPTSEDADAFFIDGGINKTFCEILLTCNQTLSYSYELYLYGY